MKVSEAINKLEVCETVWVKGTVNEINYEDRYIRAENTKTSIYLDGNAEISLSEPQAEKVEVTEKQAELLRAFRDESLYELLANCLGEDEELMAKARLFGYTVKPKRWVVKSKDHIGLESFINGTVNPMWTTEEPLWMTFTDKAKAEAVAILVEGSVEEI